MSCYSTDIFILTTNNYSAILIIKALKDLWESAHDTFRIPAYKANHVHHFIPLRHFDFQVSGSPLFVLNKSANFEYGRLKKLNEDDFVVSLLKSRQSKRVIVMFAMLQAFFMS